MSCPRLIACNSRPSSHERRQREIADAQGVFGILHPAYFEETSRLRLGHPVRVEGGAPHCGGRHALSLDDPSEKQRTVGLPLGGIHARPAPQVLRDDTGGRDLSRRTGQGLGGNQRRGGASEGKRLKGERKRVKEKNPSASMGQEARRR